MDRHLLRHLRLYGVEESDELLMAMALHIVTDDGAVEDVEGGEQCCGAMAFIVVRHGAGTARLHRQARLGAIERLDLALLVNREHNGVGRRVHVEADYVLEFLCKLWIVRQLEGLNAMWGELVGLEDALYRPQAHSRRLSQHPAGPMSCFPRWPERQV